MAVFPPRLPAATAIAVALLAFPSLACGGDGGEAPASPTPTESGTQTVQSTPTATVQPLADTFDLSTQSPLFTVYGADAGDLSGGYQALAVGDFNDDGRQDLLIGAAMADGPDNLRRDAGEAYVIFGEADLPSNLDLAEKGPDILILGASPGDSLGRTVLAADLNDDGVDDIIVGAPGVTAGEDPRTDQGRTYVFFGSPDLKETLDLADETPEYDFVVTGAEGFSRIGDALASGDVNGDGVADLILGAPFAGRDVGAPPGSVRKEAGEVYVVFGSISLADEVNIAFDEPGFMVSSDQRFGQFGAAVAAGDVNGDGTDDVIVGAHLIDVGEREAAGAVYVFFGGSDLSGRRFIARGEQDAGILAEAGDNLGLPLASADVNDDGIDDIIAGARTADGLEDGQPAAGDIHVLFGRPGLEGDFDLSQGPADLTIRGASAGHLIPTSLALSDVDGDQAIDIILSASMGPMERPAAGAIYIISGGATLQGTVDLATPAHRFAIVGAEPDDRLGSTIAVVPGDGDSPPKLLVVASDADGPSNERSNSGEVYLLDLLQR
ncbi:MAG: hypothetical protein V3V35_09325 [Dehalococcoidia bacterium]